MELLWASSGLISSADEFIYVKVWAHYKVGTHATQSKHKETGLKTKTSLCSDFWGRSWDHTALPPSKGHKVWGKKPIWRNLWHRGAEYQVTLRQYIFHKCQLWKCKALVRVKESNRVSFLELPTRMSLTRALHQFDYRNSFGKWFLQQRKHICSVNETWNNRKKISVLVINVFFGMLFLLNVWWQWQRAAEQDTLIVWH